MVEMAVRCRGYDSFVADCCVPLESLILDMYVALEDTARPDIMSGVCIPHRVMTCVPTPDTEAIGSALTRCDFDY